MMTIGFVFPGQGSQSVGMLGQLADEFPEVRATFDEGSRALGRDLWELAARGPEEALDRTENTQPAMLCADVACWRAWQRLGGPQPVLMAGHSLGEYAALVCAGALGFEDAVHLVAARARFMQEAVPEGAGAMAAILGLPDDAVAEICRASARKEIVAPVNYNAPGQIVIAGNTAAVGRAAEAARAAGAKRVVPLAVSVPSHCALMKDASERLAGYLCEVLLQRPQIGVVHNAVVREEPEPNGIRAALVAQLYSPVRWVETIRYMASRGVHRLIECGPGKVLAGLNRRIEAGLDTEGIFAPGALRAAAGTAQEDAHATRP
ncbi:MAG: ACP S-malonyltransferase [Acidiferrobacteraceae bacterium]